MRQTIHNLTFAIFTDRKRARVLEDRLDEREVEADVELLTSKRDLKFSEISRQTIGARIGLILAAALTSGLLFAGIMALAWAGVGTSSEWMLVPTEALAIGVVFSMLFGGLAGALSIMAEMRATIGRLHRSLGQGRTILLVESDYDFDRLLERHGATEVGTLV